MSITGGAKFFEVNYALESEGSEITDFYSAASAPYAIDKNPVTFWRTSGSNNLRVETLTIEFGQSRTIDRILLLDINWKQFTVKYFSGGVFVNFAAVRGLDSSGGSAISETTFADNSAYYEFTQVTTTKIQITVTTTQVADQEKYCSQIVATTELGTLLGYPKISPIEANRNIRSSRALSGKVTVQKSMETFSFDLDFKDYPSRSNYNPDFDLMMTLQDREEPFLVWLCGGRRGTNYFNYTLRGFRLKDLVLMQVVKPMKLSYSENGYRNQINTRVELDEHC